MGKTLKYGSHEFPSGFGFTGSSGQGPVAVRGHQRARGVRVMKGAPMPVDLPASGPGAPALKRGGRFEHPPDTMKENLPVEGQGMKKGGHWMAEAFKNAHGQLRKKLGAKEGHPIPAKKLAKATNSSNPKTAKQAQLAENARAANRARGGKVGALQRYAEGGQVKGGAAQAQVPATEQVEKAGRPGQPLLPGYRKGGVPRNFADGGVVADQGTTAALDARLKNLVQTTGMNLAPLTAQQQQQQLIGHGTGAYQGSPAATVGGVTVQPEREADIASRGTAPLTAKAVGAALSNALGLVSDPVAFGVRTLASDLAGLPAGGMSTIPGYKGISPELQAEVAAGRMTASRAAAITAGQQHAAAAVNAAREGTDFGGGTGNTSVAGGPSVGGLAVGNDGRIAGGIKRGGKPRYARGGRVR